MNSNIDKHKELSNNLFESSLSLVFYSLLEVRFCTPFLIYLIIVFIELG